MKQIVERTLNSAIFGQNLGPTKTHSGKFHPVPGPRKWLKLMLKLLVYIFTLGRVVLLSRSNISKICGLKIEEITNN